MSQRISACDCKGSDVNFLKLMIEEDSAMMTFHLDVRHFETSPELQLVIGEGSMTFGRMIPKACIRRARATRR